jgi:hypothetical protein
MPEDNEIVKKKYKGTESLARFYKEILIHIYYEELILSGQMMQLQQKLLKANAIRLEPTSEEIRKLLAPATSALMGADDDDDEDIDQGDLHDVLSMLTREMIFCRTVNIFLTYLSDIAAEIVIAKPEILKSDEHLKYKDILSFDNMEDLISFLAEKKISDLSYAGIKILDEFFRSRLKIDIFIDDKERDFVGFAIEVRNIFTHNYGRVNSIFTKRIPESNLRVGEQFAVDKNTLNQVEHALRSAVSRLDQQAVAKFSLPPSRIAVPD